MKFISTLDINNNTLIIHEDPLVIKYVDSTHVNINGTDYHISQLTDNIHYDKIKQLINEVGLKDKRHAFRTELYKLLNATVITTAYDVASFTESNVNIEQLGYGITIEFENDFALRQYFRMLNMPSTLKTRFKRKVKWYTPDHWNNKIMLGNDMFGNNLVISDTELSYYANIYKGWL